MLQFRWECSNCYAKGIVKVGDDIGALAASELIRIRHKQVNAYCANTNKGKYLHDTLIRPISGTVGIPLAPGEQLAPGALESAAKEYIEGWDPPPAKDTSTVLTLEVEQLEVSIGAFQEGAMLGDQDGDKVQPWMCEKCGSMGIVKFKEGHGAWHVAMIITDHHRARNEECHMENGITFVRTMGKTADAAESDQPETGASHEELPANTPAANQPTEPSQNYLMRYTMEKGPFSKQNLKDPPAQPPKDWGGCDAFMLHSIMFNADGSRDEAIVTFDGRNGSDLPPAEWHKSWTILTDALATNPNISSLKYREFFQGCFDQYLQQFNPVLWERRQANLAKQRATIPEKPN